MDICLITLVLCSSPVTCPADVERRYNILLKRFKKTRSFSGVLKHYGVDRNTIALTCIVAEVSLVAPEIIPNFIVGQSIIAFAKALKIIVDGRQDVKDRIEEMKRATELLPLKPLLRP